MRLDQVRSPVGSVSVLMAVLHLLACQSAPKPTHQAVIPDVAHGDDAQAQSPKTPGTVLVVLSSASVQPLADGSSRKTGFFLNEFYEPYQALKAAGYDVAVATVDGKRPVVDPESLKEKYWRGQLDNRERAKSFVASDVLVTRPMTLKEAEAAQDSFQGLIVPGGQGVMVDLLDNSTLHRLIDAFGEAHKPVGLVCHAPAILTRMQKKQGPFAGRHLTSVSAFEEWYIETLVMGAEASVRQIGERLEDAGFQHESGFPGGANAVRDCNLVTNQNPYSGEPFGRLFLDALRDWRGGARCVSAPQAQAQAQRSGP